MTPLEQFMIGLEDVTGFEIAAFNEKTDLGLIFTALDEYDNELEMVVTFTNRVFVYGDELRNAYLPYNTYSVSI
jgi:hypothetical protein